MSVIPIREVDETYDCKIASCPRTARTNRGRHAYLCDDHAAQARAAAQDARAAARDADPPPLVRETREEPTVRAEPDATISELADRIPAAARRLEEKLLRRRVARDEAQDAVRIFNETLRELRAAVQELA